jgi:hypothetical protein
LVRKRSLLGCERTGPLKVDVSTAIFGVPTDEMADDSVTAGSNLFEGFQYAVSRLAEFTVQEMPTLQEWQYGRPGLLRPAASPFQSAVVAE